MYHQANADSKLATAVILGIQQVLPKTMLYAPPHGELAAAALSAGLSVCHEGFIDRSYLPSGQLVPRSQAGAVIEDIESAIHQTLEIAEHHQVTHQFNGAISLPAETLCIHGDSLVAVQTLTAVRRALEAAGFEIRAKV